MTDFDNNSFTARLNILKEYLKYNPDRMNVPFVIGYISHVDDLNRFAVTYFNTDTLKIVGRDIHNETREEFNFITQSFNTIANNNPNLPSISFSPENNRKFIAHADDGTVAINCSSGVFDGQQCLEEKLCDRPNTKLSLTENRLNRLMFNNTARRKPDIDLSTNYHPTVYINCDNESVPHLEECLNGETFVNDKCVYNPVITSNGAGLVNYFNNSKYLKHTVLYRKIFINKNDAIQRKFNSLKLGNKDELKSSFNNTQMTREICKINEPTQTFHKYDATQEKFHLFNSENEDEYRLNYDISFHKANIFRFDKSVNFKKFACDANSNKVNYGNESEYSKTIGFCKKFVYEITKPKSVKPVVLVDNHEKFGTNSQVLMIPINNSYYPYDISPCLKNGPGYTFVSNQIAPTQYFECLTNNNIYLHSCYNVLHRDDNFSCDADYECDSMENGNGIIINSITNDFITFNTGRSECVNNKLVNVVECDTSNFIVDKNFNHPLTINLEVGLPKQTYDEDLGQCVNYDVANVTIINDNFKIYVKEYPDLSYSMVGRVSKIKTEEQFLNEELSSFVTYSRDLDEMFLDPHNFNAVDCIVDDGICCDTLNNSYYNICQNGNLIDQVVLNEDEFVDKHMVIKLNNYKGECRYNDNEHNYFDKMYRKVGDYECLFSAPQNFLIP